MKAACTVAGWLVIALFGLERIIPAVPPEVRTETGGAGPVSRSPQEPKALEEASTSSPPPGGSAPPASPSPPLAQAAPPETRSAALGEIVQEVIAPLVDARVASRLLALRRFLYTVSVLALANLGLMTYLIVRSLRASHPTSLTSPGPRPYPATERKPLEERLTKLEAVMTPRSLSDELTHRLDALQDHVQGPLAVQLDECATRISVLESKSGPSASPPPAAPPALQDFAALQRRMDFLTSLLEARQPPAAPPACIPLEREVLRETWKKFQRENKEILAAVVTARQDEQWRQIREPLLLHLPPCVPEDLKPTFDAVMAPPREFHHLMTKLTVVERLAGDELEKLPDAQELTRLREYVNLLVILQNSHLVADRLKFRLEPWIMDHFLGFADLFLQKVQQDAMDPQRASQDLLTPGLRIVHQVLKIADLEPVELTPGVTPFDSSRHVGRSTASDARLANGVIAGVIRNGFTRGQRIIRQPEVIVNRLG
jgi:hypothetical protein